MEIFRQIWRSAERWIRWRRPYRLEAVSDLTRINETSWEVTGKNPVWRVLPEGGVMPCGWYMWNLEIDCFDSHLFVRLYADYGEGFKEEDYFALTAKCGTVTRRICRFPRASKEVRFQIEDASPNVEIGNIGLDKVFRWFSIGCMIKRLYGRRRHPMAARARRSEDFLEEVVGVYDKCVSQKNSQITARAYQSWLPFGESWDRDVVKGEIEAFDFRPLVSVLVPAWNTPPQFLRRCIESVLVQSYPNWQLCIVDDASTDPGVSEIIEEYAAGDDRIETLRRAKNGHISVASNDALGLARGEFVALLDHDDELAEHALFEMVKTLNEDGKLDILYSDEDKIDLEGVRSDPHFKSDWNPDLLMAHNYVTHLCVYRRSLLEEVGGFRKGVEGAQDYDLLLRSSRRTTSDRIRRVPKVLYHWRAHAGSTALSGEVKSYSASAGRKALEDYLDEQGISAKVTYMPESDLLYRVHFSLPRKPLVSLLIPTRDRVDLLKGCVDSILTMSTYRNLEVIILDNESVEPETLAWFDRVQENPRVRVISYAHPFNYPAINNFGVKHARGEIIGLINNDIEVITPNWLEEMVSLALRPTTGCVGAKLFFEDSSIQHGGVILGVGGCAGHAHRGFPRGGDGYFYRLKIRHNLSAVTGACLIVRREIYEEVGGMEERLAVAFNDVDFCLRVREAGYLNVFTPYAELFHFESKSRGYDTTPEKRVRAQKEEDFMEDRWGDSLRRDPYYNPNLTLSREDFFLDQTRMLEK